MHELIHHSDGRPATPRRSPLSLNSAPAMAPPRMVSAANATIADRLLHLQRIAGNAQVTAWIASGRVLQRAPDPTRPRPASYVAHPAALADCVNVLRRFYQAAPVGTLADLRRFKTIAVGHVVATDAPEVGRLVWTANGNWNDPVVSSILGGLNAMRWDPGQSKSTRGSTGAPGDAEQRMLSHETDDEYVIKAMAVSRPLCGDCSAAVIDYGLDNGRVLIAVPLVPEEREVQARTDALTAIAAAAQRLRSQYALYSGEHAAQAALIESPSFSGFAGYWTNRLFNTEIPPPTIWLNAFAALAATDSSVRGNDVRRALANLIRARRQFLLAQRRYITWKEGLEPAAAKTQIAIGVVAVAAIAAIVAPAAVAAMAEGGAGAGATAAAEQMTVRIAASIAQADATMVAAEAAVAEAEFVAEAALEAELLVGL